MAVTLVQVRRLPAGSSLQFSAERQDVLSWTRNPLVQYLSCMDESVVTEL